MGAFSSISDTELKEQFPELFGRIYQIGYKDGYSKGASNAPVKIDYLALIAEENGDIFPDNNPNNLPYLNEF